MKIDTQVEKSSNRTVKNDYDMCRDDELTEHDTCALDD